MLFALGVAMALMAYVLVAGSPTELTDAAPMLEEHLDRA